MNIVAHHHRSSELLSSKISHFLEELNVRLILRSCNAFIVLGFSEKTVFQVSFENAFSNKSFFRRRKRLCPLSPLPKIRFTVS